MSPSRIVICIERNTQYNAIGFMRKNLLKEIRYFYHPKENLKVVIYRHCKTKETGHINKLTVL